VREHRGYNGFAGGDRIEQEAKIRVRSLARVQMPVHFFVFRFVV
jgi:hypothetical protein